MRMRNISNLSDLSNIDWSILQNRDFKRDPDDPDKIERYQAEALVHECLPVKAMIGIICYTDDLKKELTQMLNDRNLKLKIYKQTGWYFS